MRNNFSFSPTFQVGVQRHLKNRGNHFNGFPQHASKSTAPASSIFQIPFRTICEVHILNGKPQQRFLFAIIKGTWALGIKPFRVASPPWPKQLRSLLPIFVTCDNINSCNRSNSELRRAAGTIRKSTVPFEVSCCELAESEISKDGSKKTVNTSSRTKNNALAVRLDMWK